MVGNHSEGQLDPALVEPADAAQQRQDLVIVCNPAQIPFRRQEKLRDMHVQRRGEGTQPVEVEPALARQEAGDVDVARLHLLGDQLVVQPRLLHALDDEDAVWLLVGGAGFYHSGNLIPHAAQANSQNGNILH